MAVDSGHEPQADALRELLQKDWAKCFYKCATCCRVCIALVVVLVGSIGVITWASSPDLVRLTLSKPCYDDSSVDLEFVEPPPCQLIIMMPETRVVLPNPIQANFSAGIDLSFGSIGFGASATIGGLSTKCTQEGQTVGSGQGDIVYTTDCPLTGEIFLDHAVSQHNGHCRSTQCLIANSILENWSSDKFSDVSVSCEVTCPSTMKSYRDTVVLRDGAGEFLTQASAHCAGNFMVGDDKFELAPDQLATFDRHDWNMANSFMFISAMVIWALLRMLVVALSWEAHVSFDRMAGWSQRVPGLIAAIEWTTSGVGGWVAKAKYFWLTTPTNALLTSLTTLQLHSECSQLVLFNIPDAELYWLINGLMSYVVFMFAFMLMSMCFPQCADVTRGMFMMSMFPFLGAGCLLKWQDIQWSGFTFSFFFGISPAIVFEFAWPEELYSVCFSAIRVMLFVLYLYDLVEELFDFALRIFVKYGKQSTPVRHFDAPVAEAESCA